MALTGHNRSGKHIVRDSMGQLADHIRTCRRDHHCIRLLGNGHMLYLELKIPVKGIYQAFISRKGLKGDGINEIHRVFCHKHVYLRMKLHQGAGQICCLIGRDASCHSQKNGLSF